MTIHDKIRAWTWKRFWVRERDSNPCLNHIFDRVQDRVFDRVQFQIWGQVESLAWDRVWEETNR